MKTLNKLKNLLYILIVIITVSSCSTSIVDVDIEDMNIVEPCDCSAIKNDGLIELWSNEITAAELLEKHYISELDTDFNLYMKYLDTHVKPVRKKVNSVSKYCRNMYNKYPNREIYKICNEQQREIITKWESLRDEWRPYNKHLVKHQVDIMMGGSNSKWGLVGTHLEIDTTYIPYKPEHPSHPPYKQ